MIDESEDSDASETQDDDSGLRCFIDPVYTSKEIQTINDIKYGTAFNDMTGQDQDLMLDAYLPPDTDTRTARPAIVFMHGGGFTAGNRKMGRRFAETMAQRGYVVFSISYRLTGDHWSKASQQYMHDA